MMSILPFNNSLYKIATVLLFCVFCRGSSSIAQGLDHVQGELIVHLENDIDSNIWLRSFNRKRSLELGIKKRISPILDLFVVEFDFSKYNEEEMLLHLLRDKGVIMAQYNHFVNLRSTIPDDPQFGDQWQYINTGQDGGTPGADIDMDLAWDYTTGGLTAAGDTIVVCIIDDGIDDDHQDMAPNLFINHAEIPNNNIDDDGNGFVDDYRGWNTGAGNDNISQGGGHGTPVAGIVGAKGNNGIGVAGVNWDVKLMIVDGGTGVESEVLEAYSYPLSFRKKYNETNGAEGAFVVSTNASWGIDQGQPSDAPLWCAFYDTLGVYGILSCGATANEAFDIDVIGDLPTGCASDHMIAVTNMNRNDNKVNNAGWGQTTIDLGAFGAQTWTVASGNGYGSFGGTSGATPHVTGTIALLYSLPCSNVIDLAKSDPQAAATLIKNVILDGTDFNSSLEGITVSEGRLNVHNSVQLLINQYCGDCPPAIADETEIVDDYSVQLNWNLNDSINTTDLRWRESGSADWNEILNVVSPYILSNLLPCAIYEYQIKAHCNLESGDYSITNSFTSGGCCVNPSEFEAFSVEANEASLSWNYVQAALSYDVRYRIVGTSVWTEVNSIETTIELTQLESCSQYEVQWQSVCNLSSPMYTESFSFFTTGCDNSCLELPYCETFGYVATEEWIEKVVLGNLENESNSDDGYGTYHIDGPTTELIKGGSYTIKITPGYAGQNYNEFFMVWFDSNQDGEFDEISELLFTSGDLNNEEVEGIVNIPLDAKDGSSRLRVVMRYNTEPGSCTNETFEEFGEVEDYCLSIACPTISKVGVDDIQQTSALISWQGDENSEGFELRYKELIASEWITIMVDDMSYLLEELAVCTEYEVQLKTMCIAEESGFSESEVFETECTSNTIGGENIPIRIMPNPFQDEIILELNASIITEQTEIVFYNHLGQNMHALLLSEQNVQNNRINISTSNFHSGIYFAQVFDADGILETFKLVKAQ